MEGGELRDALAELARDAGLEVRTADARAAQPELPPTSSVCRVRGVVWVILSSADPLDVQIDVLAGALRTHAAARLEDRYLPPAVRARLLPREH